MSRKRRRRSRYNEDLDAAVLLLMFFGFGIILMIYVVWRAGLILIVAALLFALQSPSVRDWFR